MFVVAAIRDITTSVCSPSFGANTAKLTKIFNRKQTCKEQETFGIFKTGGRMQIHITLTICDAISVLIILNWKLRGFDDVPRS